MLDTLNRNCVYVLEWIPKTERSKFEDIDVVSLSDILRSLARLLVTNSPGSLKKL